MFLPPWQSKVNIQIKLINWFFSKPLHYRVTVTFHLFQHFLSIFFSFCFCFGLITGRDLSMTFWFFLAVQNDLHKMKVQTRVLVHLVVYLETRDEGANYYSHSFFFLTSLVSKSFLNSFYTVVTLFSYILYLCYNFLFSFCIKTSILNTVWWRCLCFLWCWSVKCNLFDFFLLLSS